MPTLLLGIPQTVSGLFKVVRNGGLPGTSTSTTNLYLGGLPLPWSVPRIIFFLSTIVAEPQYRPVPHRTYYGEVSACYYGANRG